MENIVVSALAAATVTEEVYWGSKISMDRIAQAVMELATVLEIVTVMARGPRTARDTRIVTVMALDPREMGAAKRLKH